MLSLAECCCNFLASISSKLRLLYVLALLSIFGASPLTFVEGCQSCLFSPFQHRLHQHQHHHHASFATAATSSLQRHSSQILSPSLFSNNGGFFVAALRSLSQTLERQPTVKPLLVLGAGFLISKAVVQSSVILRARDEVKTKNLEKEEDDNEYDDEEEKGTGTKPVTSAMVATIGIYKNLISPLLPPACRFLPTCSAYGVQAIEEFGPSKGGVLTVWRILRCSPFGGRGYDPPKWPPVAYNYGSY
jgi:putative membrane protein insertion efficiency factor